MAEITGLVSHALMRLQVLSPLLLDEELYYIFGRVSTLFSKSLADAYARLEPLVSIHSACICTKSQLLNMHRSIVTGLCHSELQQPPSACHDEVMCEFDGGLCCQAECKACCGTCVTSSHNITLLLC